jgi:hypothetical protein
LFSFCVTAADVEVSTSLVVDVTDDVSTASFCGAIDAEVDAVVVEDSVVFVVVAVVVE